MINILNLIGVIGSWLKAIKKAGTEILPEWNEYIEAKKKNVLMEDRK